jgi:hypothetical protein
MQQVDGLWRGHARDPKRTEFEPPRRQERREFKGKNAKCKTSNSKFKMKDASPPNEKRPIAGVVKRDPSPCVSVFHFALHVLHFAFCIFHSSRQ